MLIEFTEPGDRSEMVIFTAASVGATAQVKWSDDTGGVRFTLHQGAQQARFETVSEFIDAILVQDPEAFVRTARAAYRGLADYRQQTGRGVTAPCPSPESC